MAGRPSAVPSRASRRQPGPRNRRRWVGLLTVIITSWVGAASAENPDKFYLSGDAALQGGAITADARGGGSIWYNPAGLAEMPGLRVDVNMNAYSFRFGKVPEFAGTGEGTEVTRLSKIDFSVAPAALTLTKKFGDLGVGFGMFVPRLGKTAIRTRIRQPGSGEVPGVDLGADINSNFQEYLAGPSVGYRLGKGVDIGGSLFVHYRTQLDVIGTNIAVDLPGGDLILDSTHSLLDSVQIGLQPTLGVQLHPGKGFHVGMLVRFPSFRLYQIVQRVDIHTSSEGGPPANETTFTDETGISTNVVRPGRFHLGLSRDFGKMHLAIEGSYQLPFRNTETEEEFRPLFSGRIGGKAALSDTMAVGGGLFVSPSTSREPEEFGDSQIDYYGLTAALDMGTPYVVTSRGETKLRKPGKLIFGTTLALTYSIGVGSMVRAEVGFDDDLNFFRQVPVDVTAHEIIFSLGSSLSE